MPPSRWSTKYSLPQLGTCVKVQLNTSSLTTSSVCCLAPRSIPHILDGSQGFQACCSLRGNPRLLLDTCLCWRAAISTSGCYTVTQRFVLSRAAATSATKKCEKTPDWPEKSRKNPGLAETYPVTPWKLVKNLQETPGLNIKEDPAVEKEGDHRRVLALNHKGRSCQQDPYRSCSEAKE
jgi:hypothetical protein